MPAVRYHHRRSKSPCCGSGEQECPAMLGILFLAFFIMVLIFLWLLSKSSRKGPLRHTPVIPFPQDKLQLFTGPSPKSVRIRVSNEPTGTRRTSHRAIKTMNEWMKWMFGSEFKHGLASETVPRNARTISIKMDGFEHGTKCHDFIPIDGMALGSYYTYQMYGNNRIQVTCYVEYDISYVAGFCIYIEKPSIDDSEYSKSVVEKLFRSSKYPGRPQKCSKPLSSYNSVFVV